MTPYAVSGTICDLHWEELYSCNNGGGLEDRKCKITVHTGLQDNDDRSKGTKNDRNRKASDSKTNKIQKTTKVDDELRKTLTASASAGINIGFKGFGLNGKVSTGMTDTEFNSKSVTDMASVRPE